MDIYEEIVKNIIKEQENIIGPLALEQAEKVTGLKIDWKSEKIDFQGSKEEIIKNLFKQYERLFGQASVEVCKDAARDVARKFPSENISSLIG